MCSKLHWSRSLVLKQSPPVNPPAVVAPPITIHPHRVRQVAHQVLKTFNAALSFSDHDLAVAALVVQVVVQVVVSEEWVGDGPRLAAETPVEHLVVVAQAAVAQVVEDRC